MSAAASLTPFLAIAVAIASIIYSYWQHKASQKAARELNDRQAGLQTEMIEYARKQAYIQQLQPISTWTDYVIQTLELIQTDMDARSARLETDHKKIMGCLTFSKIHGEIALASLDQSQRLKVGDLFSRTDAGMNRLMTMYKDNKIDFIKVIDIRRDCVAQMVSVRKQLAL